MSTLFPGSGENPCYLGHESPATLFINKSPKALFWGLRLPKKTVDNGLINDLRSAKAILPSCKFLHLSVFPFLSGSY